MTAPVLSTRVLNRTLLARQHLLARATMPALEMIEHLAGLQAQEPKDPYVALWSRLEGFQPAELESLLVERRAVRSVLMRSTVHLASIDDALAFRPVVQPVLDWELFRNKTWSVGLEGVDLEPVLDLGRRLMEERPRSLAELRAAMAERFPRPGRDDARLRLPRPPADAAGPAAWPVGDERPGEADDAGPLERPAARHRDRPRRDDPALPRGVRAGEHRATSRRGRGSRVSRSRWSGSGRGSGSSATSAAASCSTSRTRRSPIRDLPAPVRLLPELRQRVPVPRRPVARRARGRCARRRSARRSRSRRSLVDGFGAGFWTAKGQAGRAVDHPRADAAADGGGAAGGRGRGARAAAIPRGRPRARSDPLALGRLTGGQQRFGCAAGWASS